MPQSPLRFEVDQTDADREKTWSALNEMLPHGGMFGLRPLAHEVHEIGTASVLVRVADDDGDIGAAYIGPSWEEAHDITERGAPDLGVLIAGTVRTLHGIAVKDGSRDAGVGSALLNEAENLAITQDVGLIIGVAQGDPRLGNFYTRHGYVVGEPARPIVLKPGGSSLIFPQDAPNARWFYKLLKPDAPVRAFHPSDKQIRLMEIATGR